MIVGSNGVNFLNYIYHFVMGRLLGPVSYGELATLFSLVTLIGMISLSLGLVIVKYVSSAQSREEVESLMGWFNKRMFIAVTAFSLLLILISPFVASFIGISHPAVIILVAVSFLFMIPSAFNRSVLQGLTRFKEMVISTSVEALLKLILGVGLVYFGFSVGGAMVGLVIAIFVGWLLARRFIADYAVKETKAPNIRPLLIYSLPVLVQSVAVTSLYSVDVILVKHFLPPFEAGLYAALSALGKIIYFGVGPITSVMFPLVSKRHSKGEKYYKIFFYSLCMTLLIGGVVLGFYWLLPNLAIKLLFGSAYLSAAPYLFLFGIFMLIFSLATLFINLYLSIGRVWIVVLPFLAAVLQIIGIWFNHGSLWEVITVSTATAALLLLSISIYFIYDFLGQGKAVI